MHSLSDVPLRSLSRSAKPLEARAGIEPTYGDLQSRAIPCRVNALVALRVCQTGAAPVGSVKGLEGESVEWMAMPRGLPPKPVADRLLSKVTVNPVSGCWEWGGNIGPGGYGLITIGSRTDGTRRTVRAHRASHEAFVGPIGDLWVLHRCDNPPCINPEHLFLGDRLANVLDCIEKGRWARPVGEQAPGAKMTEELVMELRRKAAAGELVLRREAMRLGYTDKTLRDAIRGWTWSHLPGAVEFPRRDRTAANASRRVNVSIGRRRYLAEKKAKELAMSSPA